jgi:maltooligosyltrehalose synthase
MPANGQRSQNILSFARRQDEDWCLILAPRWLAQDRTHMNSFEIDWQDTRIAMPPDAPRSWKNILTGAFTKTLHDNGQNYVELKDALRDFPLALLAPENASE